MPWFKLENLFFNKKKNYDFMTHSFLVTDQLFLCKILFCENHFNKEPTNSWSTINISSCTLISVDRFFLFYSTDTRF